MPIRRSRNSVLGAGCDHKPVECNTLALSNYLARRKIDAGDLLRMTVRSSGRAGYCALARRYRREIDLRSRPDRAGLEQMIIVAVDQRYGEIGPGETLGERQPTKAGTDHNNAELSAAEPFLFMAYLQCRPGSSLSDATGKIGRTS